MSITFKTFTGDSVEVASIFESSIVTDNIAALDGSVTFLSPIDLTENMDVGGNSITNINSLTSSSVTATNLNISSINNPSGTLTLNDDVSIIGSLSMNNSDIDLVGTLGVDTVNSITTNASSIFTGDLVVSGDLSGSGGSIDVTDDLLLGTNNITAGSVNLSTQLYITDTPGFASPVSQIHIQNLQNASIFLEADTNNITETDVSFIMFSQDGGDTAMNITGGNNVYSIISSTLGGTRGLNLSLGNTVSNGQGNLPTIDTISPKIQIRDTLTTLTQHTAFSNTDLQDVDTIEVSSLISNTTIDPNINIESSTVITDGSNLTLVNRTIDDTPQYILGLTSGDVTVRRLLTSFDVFGRFYQSAESSSVTSSASAVSFTLKVGLTTAVVEAGTYYVSFSCLATNSSGAQQTELQFTEDGTPLGTPIAFYSNTNGVNEQYCPSNMVFIRTLTAASHTYNLSFRPTGGTSRLSDAKIIFYRVE